MPLAGKVAGLPQNGNKSGKPEAGLVRRNSDGGAGVAGILKDMEMAEGVLPSHFDFVRYIQML